MAAKKKAAEVVKKTVSKSYCKRFLSRGTINIVRRSGVTETFVVNPGQRLLYSRFEKLVHITPYGEEEIPREGSEYDPAAVESAMAVTYKDVVSDKVDAIGHIKEEDLRNNNVMSEALKIIYGDREKTYGHPSLNLESIAQLWTVYMKRKAYVELTRSPFADDSDLKQVELIVPKITIDDVCQMMVLLKMARLINDPTHHDSMVDQVGYIGLQERVQL